MHTSVWGILLWLSPQEGFIRTQYKIGFTSNNKNGRKILTRCNKTRFLPNKSFGRTYIYNKNKFSIPKSEEILVYNAGKDNIPSNYYVINYYFTTSIVTTNTILSNKDESSSPLYRFHTNLSNTRILYGMYKILYK